MDIAGKVFIVTGGASGLGEGTARMLAAHGGKVVVPPKLLGERGETAGEGVNQVEIGSLSPLERRIVREGLRQARKAQSRLRLDFPG